MQKRAAFVLLIISICGSQTLASSHQSERNKTVDYDLFAKLNSEDRAKLYSEMSPENRVELAKTHGNRWLQKYKTSLLNSDIAAIQERIAKLAADLFRSSNIDKTFIPEGNYASQYLSMAFDFCGPYLPNIVLMEKERDRIFEEALPPVDPEEQAKRIERNRQHDQGKLPQGFRRPLTEVQVTRHVDRIVPPYFYFLAKCSHALLGTVEKEQPYLSEDGSFIYTEFSVCTEQLLKNDTTQPLSPGENVVIEREGGKLRLRSGQVVEFVVDGNGISPQVGARYLFFIGKEKGAFVTPEAYEIRDGMVFPLFSFNPPAPAVESDFFKALYESLKKSR